MPKTIRIIIMFLTLAIHK